MTIYYVDSAAGSNTSPYNSWATAATSLATIAAIDAAGDTVYVASTESEAALAANPSYAWAGTSAAPTTIICADKTSGAPPATAATGATIGTASAVSLTAASTGVVYMRGMTFSCGGGTSSSATLTTAGAAGQLAIYDSCSLVLNNSGAGLAIANTANGSLVQLNKCTLKFGATGQVYSIAGNGAAVEMTDCTIDGTGSAITRLLNVNAGGGATLRGCDLSACAASLNIVSTTNAGVVVNVVDCKLPASWTGAPNGSVGGPGTRISLIRCDSAATNYRLAIDDGSGTIRDNETNVLSGGATDGTTPIAWTLSSNSQATPQFPLASDWHAAWNDTSGVSKTLTWQYLADAGVVAGQGSGTANAFQNNQVWIEVRYPGSSSSPLGSPASSGLADPLATATSNAAGSGTWTTTGLTTPKQGQCSVTFTPQQKGVILSRICIGAASKTIYADPQPTLA